VFNDCSPCLTFGKYRGYALINIPSGYLQWCLRECESLDDWLRPYIRRELASRGVDSRPPQTRTPPPPAVDWQALIKRWHHDLVMRWHPDRSGSHEAMCAVNDAVERLRHLFEAAS
jgi:hypothetical protein